MDSTDKKFLLNRDIIIVKESSDPNSKSDDMNTFSVLQWNTLNTILCDEASFPKIPKEYLDWSYRKTLFSEELPKFNADFICLEEVHGDQIQFYKGCLGSNYNFIYKEKGNEIDTLCFFYKKKKYEHIRTLTGSYIDITNNNKTMTQVFQINTFRIPNTNNFIMIIFTHLKAKVPFENDRVIQMTQLIKNIATEREQIEKIYNKDTIDIQIGTILCGDLNTEPDSKTVGLIEACKIFKSAYEDAKFTTFKIRSEEACRVIDYIWYSNQLSLTQKLSIPTKDQIGPLGLPNMFYPSDHLSLFAKFKFNEKQKNTKKATMTCLQTGGFLKRMAYLQGYFVQKIQD